MDWDQTAICSGNDAFGGRGNPKQGDDYGAAPNVDHSQVCALCSASREGQARRDAKGSASPCASHISKLVADPHVVKELVSKPEAFACPLQEYVRNDIIEWLNYLRKDVGFDGWRFDFVRGWPGHFAKQYIEATDPAFALGECAPYAPNVLTG